MGSSADCKLEEKKTWPKTDRQTLKFCVFLPSPHTHTHTLGEFSGPLFFRDRRCDVLCRCSSAYSSQVRAHRFQVRVDAHGQSSSTCTRLSTNPPGDGRTDSSSFLRSLARSHSLSPLLHWLSKGCYDSGISLPQTPEKNSQNLPAAHAKLTHDLSQFASVH